MVSMARCFLDDPHWGWHAAKALGRRGGAARAICPRRPQAVGARRGEGVSVGKPRFPRRPVRRALSCRLERADQGRARSAVDHDADLDRLRRRGACCLLPFVGLPAWAAWPWLVASVVIHLFYFAALIEAYRTGDLGQVYPIARGSAPLMTATATTIFVGEKLSVVGWGGIVALVAGVLLLSAARRPRSGEDRPPRRRLCACSPR